MLSETLFTKIRHFAKYELSIELPESYTSAKICYLNGVNNGYILSRTLNGKSYITRLDETGMVLWHKSFNYAGISFINQIDTTFYILANSGNQSFLHQIDDNGNTILFRKIIHSDKIQLNDITLTDSTTFLISGLIQMPGLPNWNFNSLLIETDTLFQLLDSKIGNDTLFYLSTNSRYRPSTVFNKYNTGTTPNYIHVENRYFDSTACSFSPISLVANPFSGGRFYYFFNNRTLWIGVKSQLSYSSKFKCNSYIALYIYRNIGNGFSRQI